ncbi:class E sortase [Candidatus Saccharibacteria bacterium]|nr:class E sortase [Candidatus Saccharibacteria bacterium]
MDSDQGGQSQSGSRVQPGGASGAQHFDWRLKSAPVAGRGTITSGGGAPQQNKGFSGTSGRAIYSAGAKSAGGAYSGAQGAGIFSSQATSLSSLKPRSESAGDLQRKTAASLARKKVLAAYADSARQREQARQQAVAQSQSTNKPNTVNPARPSTSHLKDAAPRINSESWKQYHAAWQNYYQKYYSDYYSRAARTYIETEKLKQARERAEEDDILESIARTSRRFGKKDKDGKMSLNTGVEVNASASEIAENDDIRARLRSKIRKSAVKDIKKVRRHRKLIPIFAGIAVALLILFLQYNRMIFAPIYAYVSPGNVPASEIEAVDPTITKEVSADPRLIIPKLNVDVPVHFDIPLSEVMSAMNNGVAHYRIPGASAFPGEIGNTVITGHSAGDIYSSNPYKYIFSGLERLENGDLIYVNYKSVRYTYRVIKKEIVLPTNVAALVVETDKPLLTLVTCTPLGTSEKRLLVTAEQISPNTSGAEAASDTTIVVDKNEEALPSNSPTFFEGLWGWMTGN